jgi:hypothetical protein
LFECDILLRFDDEHQHQNEVLVIDVVVLYSQLSMELLNDFDDCQQLIKLDSNSKLI